jgi:hypothetical protein
VHSQDVTPAGGQYSLTLQPGRIYTVTTTTGQGKGTATSPPQAGLGLPHSDGFDADATGTEATYLSDQNGSFEIRPCVGGRAGQCVRQMAATAPINWDTPSNPYTLLGDLGWTDYTVSADAYLEQAGAVQLLGRVQTQQPFSVAGINDYYLQINSTGAWSIVKNTTGATLTTLASGTTTAPGTGSWHHLAVSFQGSTITASLDGHTLGSATDSSYRNGQVGLGTNGWQTDDFDNLAITPIGAQHVSTVYQLVNRNSGDVLDVGSGGTAIVQNPNTGVASQQWQLLGNDNGADTLVNAGSGKALDVPGSSTTAGTALDQATGTGGANQQWSVTRNADGYYTVTNQNSHLVADVNAASTSAGATVLQWTATGGTNQEWSLVPVPVVGATYVLTNVNSGMVMDVNTASTSDGAAILQWPYHGGANERWTFTAAGTAGAFTLVSANSGKVLDVPGRSTTQGTALDQWTSDGGTNQQWTLRPVGNAGAYQLVNVGSGMVADVNTASTTAGATVLQWPSTGGTNQQWTLGLTY